MRSTFAAVLVGAGVLVASGEAPAQSLGFSEINWCKWENPPLGELRAAIAEMERQLADIERAIDLMTVFEGLAGGEDGPRDFGELLAQIEAMRIYARLGRFYDSRHHVLNCLYNKLEELEARNDVKRGPAGPRRQIGALKDKAGALKQRRDRLGPAHDTIDAAPEDGGGYRIATGRGVYLYRNRTLRRASGGTARPPWDVELDVGFDFRAQFNPDFRVGAGGASREFGADTRMFLPRVELRMPLRDVWGRPAWMGIRARGGTSDHTRRGADLSGAGQIFSIDGTNAQAIAASRDARLELHYDTIDINAYVASRILSWNAGAYAYTVFAGFQFVRDRWTYDFNQLVSGGGPFFAQAVRSGVSSDFYGARLGGAYEHRIADNATLTITGHVTPGYQRDRLSAMQFPGTFGPGTLEVGERRNGFAVRTGVSTNVEARAGPTVFIGGGIGYEHNSRLPRIDGLTGGRARLGLGRADSLILMIRARIVLP